MTAPIPEEQDQPPTPVATPPGEHEGELPDKGAGAADAAQEENAETSLDEPSDDAGGEA
jgi:hypothetical protein